MSNYKNFISQKISIKNDYQKDYCKIIANNNIENQKELMRENIENRTKLAEDGKHFF